MASLFRVLSCAVVAAGLASTAVGQQSAECSRCDTMMKLSSAEFACLQSKLPTMSSRTTRFVFFNLSPESCEGAPEDRTRSVDTRLPRVVNNAPKVFKLPVERVRCLSEKVGAIEPDGDGYVLDLVSLCP